MRPHTAWGSGGRGGNGNGGDSVSDHREAIEGPATVAFSRVASALATWLLLRMYHGFGPCYLSTLL